MYKVCRLRLGPNFGIRPAAGKNFSLWLTVEKMRAFAVFNDKYLRPWGSRSTISMADVNCKNRKTKIKSKIIKTATSLFAITFYNYSNSKTHCKSINAQKRIENTDVFIYDICFCLKFVICLFPI